MSENFANAAYSQLSASITAIATSLSVLSGHGTRFPAVNFRIAVWDAMYESMAEAYRAGAGEWMLVTNVATDTFTVTRAYEDPASVGALAFDTTIGKVYRVEHVLTGGVVTMLNSRAIPFTMHNDSITFSGTTHQYFALNTCNSNGTLTQRTAGGTPVNAGTFKNLKISAYSAARGMSVTLMCDGVDTALTKTTSAGSGPSGVYTGDSTHTVVYAGSDALPNGGVLLDLYIPTGSGSTAVTIIDISVEFVPA